MAVPDWPNTYGYNMFFFPVSQWVGGIFYEHSHRLVASAVGLMTSVMALGLYGRKARPLMRWLGVLLLCGAAAILVLFASRWTDAVVIGLTGLAMFGASFVWPSTDPAPKWLRRLGLAAFFLVVTQGVLGGLRVTEMMDELGIFHGTLAQVFFCLICAMALFTSPFWRRAQGEQGAEAPIPPVPSRVVWLFSAATLVIFVQLAIGATMRHQHAGLAIPDFPLAYGRLWPATDSAAIETYNRQRLEILAVKPITAAHVILQMVHRITAAVISFLVIACAISAWRKLGRQHLLTRLGITWCLMIFAQVLLGAATVWSNKAADFATAHVILGALSLALGAIACIVALRFRNPARRGAELTTPTAVPGAPFARQQSSGAGTG